MGSEVEPDLKVATQWIVRDVPSCKYDLEMQGVTASKTYRQASTMVQ